MKKILLIAISFLLFPLKSSAFCPLCVVATGIGVGIFRWLGVDDVIVGAWVGALALSVAVLLGKFLGKKVKKEISYPLSIVTVFASFITILFLGGFFRIENRIFGVEKMFWGIIAGSILLLAAPMINKFIKNINGGKIIFPYQKIAIAISLLAVFSFAMYLGL